MLVGLNTTGHHQVSLLTPGFQLILHVPFYVRGPLSDSTISYKIWDVINEFPLTVYTSGSSHFLKSYTDISNSTKASFGEQFQRRYEFLKTCMS
jgi:hypothetical protein